MDIYSGFKKRYLTLSREPFFEICKVYINKKSRILDLGSGEGSFGEYIGRLDTVCMDRSEHTCSVLRDKGYQNVLHQSVTDKFACKSRSFDLIHCSHLVEHLDQNELYHLMKEIKRCICKNGVVVISAPMMWRGFYNDLSHIRPYNPGVFPEGFLSAD